MTASDIVFRGCPVALVLCVFCLSPAQAEDSEISKLLKDKGGKVTEVKGVVTAVAVSDGSKLTDTDFRELSRLAHLKTLDLNGGLNDDRLALLAGLAELEYLQTNQAQVSDDGLKSLARLRGLRNLKFFHPGKAFSGAGLAHLAELPSLERLTVAGSLAFNDDGMAAVARLTRLQEVRVWHAGVAQEGVKSLKALKNLKSLHLGQRLTYQPPACPSDETLAILAELTSLETLQLEEARLSFDALRQLAEGAARGEGRMERAERIVSQAHSGVVWRGVRGAMASLLETGADRDSRCRERPIRLAGASVKKIRR
jgi:hypothetical protein